MKGHGPDLTMWHGQSFKTVTFLKDDYDQGIQDISVNSGFYLSLSNYLN